MQIMKRNEIFIVNNYDMINIFCGGDMLLYSETIGVATPYNL